MNIIVDRLAAIGKPMYIIGQSIGPFTSPESVNFAKQILVNFDKIILREGLSKQYAAGLGSEIYDKIEVTTDIAFGHNQLFEYKVEGESTSRALLNFRGWRHGTRQCLKSRVFESSAE